MGSRHAVVKQQRAEALQDFVALAGKGFEKPVSGDFTFLEQSFSQVSVRANQLDERAGPDSGEASTTDGEPISVWLGKSCQVNLAAMGFEQSEEAPVGHLIEPFGEPRLEEIGIALR
ncbi:hypothetical protein [Streptomyces acidiscabies]|uniref:hypothetical protein n=1 Tax=Streptomyces acidiscabies TaxID=42234 RepID=UPI000D1B3AB9|nr:hypothetical protein [Streptomyces acidiscabies]